MKRSFLIILAVVVLVIISVYSLVGGNRQKSSLAPAVQINTENAWLTQRCDNRRSGVTAMQLPDNLHLQWVHQSGHKPMPAWPVPLREFHRMPFDYSYQMVSAGGILLYGSSADCKLYALEVSSGKVLWEFYTGGPIRFSPSIYNGSVYLAGDDGFVYCLGLESGELLWNRRIGPRDDCVIGNDRVISRWPLRSGVMVKDGVVYVTAGMWNIDGVYITALDSATGKIVWQNDVANYIYTIGTHGEEGIVNVPPQGYLLADKGALILPTGRGPPAGFDIKTGKLLWYTVEFGKPHHAGSSWAFVNDGMVFTLDRKVNSGVAPMSYKNTAEEYFHNWPQGLMSWDVKTGKEKMGIADVQRAVADGNVIYCANNGELLSADFMKLKEYCWKLRGTINRDKYKKGPNAYWWMNNFGILAAESRLNSIRTGPFTNWKVKCPGRVYDMIMAGDKIYLGSKGKLVAYNAETGKKVFEVSVKGRVRGIIAADGKVFASTDTGAIYCFGEKKISNPAMLCLKENNQKQSSSDIARKILSATGIDGGYALLYGSDVSVAAELVNDSRFTLCCFDENEERMTASRKKLDAINLYGTRVSMHSGSYDDLPYINYFANLIVAAERLDKNEVRELYRILRPGGGRAYLSCSKVPAEQWKDLLRLAGVEENEIKVSDDGVIVTRRSLAGAGDWTHQFGDTGNTFSSQDTIVRPPFNMQWWGVPGPASAVSRHQYGANPVAAGGRFFMTGRHTITCGDIYNGFVYWTFHYPNIGRIGAKSWGGGQVTDSENVYVASGDSCLVIDAKTGKLKNTFGSPVVKKRYSVKSPETFSVKVGQETEGEVIIKTTPDSLVFELERKDKELVEQDGWELFFDFRSCGKREPLYTKGSFRIDVRQRQGGAPSAQAAKGTVCPAFDAAGKNTATGSSMSITFSLAELEKLAGTKISEFRFGACLTDAPYPKQKGLATPEQVDDPHGFAYLQNFLFAAPYNHRLTCGLGEFSLGEGGTTGGKDFYDPQTSTPFYWNHLAVSDGLIFGTSGSDINFLWQGRPQTNPQDEFVFALDKETGDMKWLIKAENTFHPLSVAIDDKQIYFIDKKAGAKTGKRRGKTGKSFASLKAADKFTGKIVWETISDEFSGTNRLQLKDGVLCLSASSGIVGVSAKNGEVLWRQGGGSKPPVILKDRFFWKPNQFDLHTGEKKMMVQPVTGEVTDWLFHTSGRGGCGEMSGCPNALFFRDGYTAYHDLATNNGEHWVGGIRPSCAINILPVGGLVVQPEGSAGCTCSGYSFQASMALAPAPEREDLWTALRSTTEGLLPIKDLKLNFGAPGDKMDGSEWYLAFPRNYRPSYQMVPVMVGDCNVSYLRRNPDHLEIQGTEKNWLYSSQAVGIKSFHLDLLFNRPVVAQKLDKPLTIDGVAEVKLDGNPNLIRLSDKNRTIYPSACVLFNYDDQNLYVTLKREAPKRDGKYVEWTANTSGEDALAWKDDSWDIRISAKYAACFDISASGARSIDVHKGSWLRSKKFVWNWKSAVGISRDGGTWITELAIPWADLEKNIQAQRNVSVYIQGFNQTGIGPDEFEYKHRQSKRHRIGSHGVSLLLQALPAQDEKHYKLVLHFAEMEDVKPQQRVFDVLVQGETVIEGLDVVKEAGGRFRALSREIGDISGTDYLDLEFVPHKGSLPAVINGLELIKK